MTLKPRDCVNKLNQQYITKYFKPVDEADEDKFLRAATAKYFGWARELAERGYTMLYAEGYKKVVLKRINDVSGESIKVYENVSQYNNNVKISGHLELIREENKSFIYPESSISNMMNEYKSLPATNLKKKIKQTLIPGANNGIKNKPSDIDQNKTIDALIKLANSRESILEKVHIWHSSPNTIINTNSVELLITHVLNGIANLELKEDDTGIKTKIYLYNLYAIYSTWVDLLYKDSEYKYIIKSSNGAEKTIVFSILNYANGNTDYKYSRKIEKGKCLYFILNKFGHACILELEKKRSLPRICSLNYDNWCKFKDKSNSLTGLTPHNLDLLPNDLQNMFISINTEFITAYWEEIKLNICKLNMKRFRSLARYIYNIEKKTNKV